MRCRWLVRDIRRERERAPSPHPSPTAADRARGGGSANGGASRYEGRLIIERTALQAQRRPAVDRLRPPPLSDTPEFQPARGWTRRSLEAEYS